MSSTICFADTGLYVDTVEWCPHQGHQNLFVCGTYQLLEQPPNQDYVESSEHVDDTPAKPVRVGNIQLYSFNESNETHSYLEKLQCIETAGILDTKWCCGSSTMQAILGAVTAEGEVKTFILEREEEDVKSPVQLSEISNFVIDANKLCLSLDWAPVEHGRKPEVVVSDSVGCLTVLRCKQGSWDMEKLLQWTGHQYEAWITAFNRWTPNVIYSGGDDCLLKGWDTREGCCRPIFTSKRHSMGVSSIQCNPVHEHIVATGSYDESILVWDNRAMKVPLCTGNPGGGVWRIKWHPETGDYMLTASMYEGFHVLKFDRENGVAVNFAKTAFKLSLTHRNRSFGVDDYLQGAKFVGLRGGLAAES